jgi:hypothetical protein
MLTTILRCGRAAHNAAIEAPSNDTHAQALALVGVTSFVVRSAEPAARGGRDLLPATTTSCYNGFVSRALPRE